MFLKLFTCDRESGECAIVNLLNKLQSQKGNHKKAVRMDFLAFSEPSSQNQWENDWADMNFKKIAIWTTLVYRTTYIGGDISFRCMGNGGGKFFGIWKTGARGGCVGI